MKLQLFRLRSSLFDLLALGLAATTVLSLFLATTIARPLGKLTRAAERLAAGDRDARLALDRRDEIGQLARAIERMTAELERRARDRAPSPPTSVTSSRPRSPASAVPPSCCATAPPTIPRPATASSR